MKNFGLLNRILLGLVMLIPGLFKLFVAGPNAVVGMMQGIVIFAWAPVFWAWVLILSEIIFGIAILANFKLEYTTIPPIIILLVAAFTVYFNYQDLLKVNWPTFLLHIAAASNYALLGYHGYTCAHGKVK